MNKYIALITILLMSQFLMAQSKKSATPERKFHFGGGIQLSIGRGYTSVGISPSVIYDINKHFSTGLGVSYLYGSQKFSDTKYHVFGGSVLLLYNPIKEIQFSMEFEQLRINSFSGEYESAYNIPALYLGLGYGLGNRSSIGIRYDLLWDENKSINDSAFTPYFRIYF